MPKRKQVTRITNRQRKTGGIRDKIRNVGENNYGLRVNFYGRGKTGKTTLACDFPKPLLLIGTMGTLEDGTLSISDQDVDFFPLQSVNELDELIDVTIEEQYKTVVLDTGGGLQDMILKEHLNLSELPVQKTWGMAKQSDWQIVGMQAKERLSQLLRLSMSDSINVVIIAHERSFTDSDNDDGSIAPTVGSALSPSVASWLNGACDYVCQTFVREETTTKSIKLNGKETTQKIATGKAEYCLRIGPHPVYLTGFRKPKTREIPDVIVDPTYEKIRSLIT